MLNEFLKANWAIDPEYYFKMHGILERKYIKGEGGIDLEQYNNAEANKDFVCYVDAQDEVEKDRAVDGKSSKKEGIAVITMNGPMFKKANMLQQISGAKSTEMIVQAIQDANANSLIHGIVLLIDSPGGTVDGTEVLTEEIKKSRKPIVSFVDGMMASAAYWAGSSASHIMASGETALIGSIGTMMVHTDQSGFLTMNGVKLT